MIPDPRILQGDINQLLMNVLVLSVTTLCQNISLSDTLTPHQQLCWGVVATCSSKIPVSHSCNWIETYHCAIVQIGKIFKAYCNARSFLGSSCILSQCFPREISESASGDITRYLQWVKKSQDMLITWQRKFRQSDVSYDDVILYTNHHASINDLSQVLCAPTLVVDREIVNTAKNLLTTKFDQLCIYLLKYIPGHPEAHWCTLPTLLANYGVSLPLHLQDTISKHLVFPGDQKPLVGDLELFHTNISDTITSQFHPGRDTFLKLSCAFTLKKLFQLVQDIKGLLQGISKEHMDMLVFFHLQQSKIFKKHLLNQLEKETTMSASASLERSTVSPFFTSLPTHHPILQQPQQQKQPDGVTLEMLEQALDSVHCLTSRLVTGTATYSDIVAGGALKLEFLNIQRELEIFTCYANHTGLTNTEGLARVLSMLGAVSVYPSY